MANTQSICKSFRVELLNGIHAFGTTVVRAGTGADTFKAALYLASATVDSTTTAYSATGEVSGTNYTAGGITVTNGNAPANTGGTGVIAFWTPSANFVWNTVTLSTAFDAVLLYNSSQGNKAVAVFTFGSQTVTAGNFTLTMPTNDLSTGLIRIS
ncbi:MAG TPA: hypothetical protein VNH18_15790 [Bryobacteraceae bacterium]|nr:hypothetical protein [Bryobacteraceae bacterium]